MDNQQTQQFNNQPGVIPPPQEETSFLKKKINFIIGLIVILIIASGVGFYIWKLSLKEPVGSSVNVSKPTDEIANWQIYRNDEYGFEIKYSSKWEQFTGTGGEGGLGPDEFLRLDLKNEYMGNDSTNIEGLIDSISISEEVGLEGKYKDLAAFKTALDAVKKNNEYSELYISSAYSIIFWDVNQILFNNIPALRVQQEDAFGGAPFDYIYVFHNGKFLSIFSTFGPAGEKEGDQILSTFKFIKPNETASWQTYRNEKYGFEVRYPEGYNVKIDNDEVGLLLANFRNSQENSFYGIHVTQNSKTPKLSNFLSNPECYEQIKTETQNNLEWTISWWKCSAGGDKNPIAAYTVKRNYVFEVLLDSDSQDLSLKRINQILSTFKFIK